MQNPAYLSLSRHGIWYFRWPIPKHFHPASKATDIKISLGTRAPAVARQLLRVLVCAGQSALLAASLRPMRYDEIRRQVHTARVGIALVLGSGLYLVWRESIKGRVQSVRR